MTVLFNILAYFISYRSKIHTHMIKVRFDGVSELRTGELMASRPVSRTSNLLHTLEMATPVLPL
jgi:hypothetical protein